jgi:hypothetical protein
MCTDVLPAGFIVSKVIPEMHSVSEFNPIKRTKMYGCMGESPREPTYVDKWVRDDGEVLDPLSKTRLKYVTSPGLINRDLLDYSAVMLGTMVSTLAGTGRRAFRLTTEEALNGAYDEGRFSTKTSPGGKYIMKGIKKSDIVKLDGEELDFSSVEGQNFLKDIEKATYERENNIISLCYINEFAKGELLPSEKIYEGKLRLICGDDADQCIADKKEYAWLNYLLKKIPIASGLCIGYNPNSMESHFKTMLLKVFNRIVPGDNGGWDTTMWNDIFKAIGDFVTIVGYDADDVHIRAMRTCIQNLLYKLHIAHLSQINFKDGKISKQQYIAIYEWAHGQISGSYTTLLFNTIGCALFGRYIILCLYVEYMLDIKYYEYDPVVHGAIDIMEIEKNIICFDCGDDISISVSPKLDFVTFERMRQLYAEHNMKFTTDMKSDDLNHYLTIDDFCDKPTSHTFCKRYTRWIPEMHRYSEIQNLESIRGSLYFSEDFKEHRQVIDQAFKDLSAHGEQVFNEYAKHINSYAVNYYGYSSPYRNYKLALHTLFDGLTDKCVKRMLLKIENKETLSPEESKYFEDWEIVESPEIFDDSVRGAISNSLTEQGNKQEQRIKPEMEQGSEANEASFQDDYNDVGESMIVEAIPVMDPITSVENLRTTTFVDDGVQAEESQTSIDKYDNFSHNFTDIREFLGRPQYVAEVNWQTTHAQAAILWSDTIVNLLYTNTTWKNHLRGYGYFRAKAVFTFQVNANQFQQGKLLTYFLPNAANRPAVDLNSYTATLLQRTMLPSLELDCRQTTGRFEVEFIAPEMYLDLSVNNYGWGNIALCVLAPLRSNVASVTPVTIWLHFENVEVAVPVPANSIMDVKKEEKAVNVRPVSTALKQVGKVAGTLSSIPLLSSYMKPLEWAANVSSKIAYTLGYAKPVQDDKTTLYVQNYNRYSANADGPDTSIPLALSSQNAVVRGRFGTPRNVDELSMAFLKSRECLYQTVSWSNTQTVGTTLWNFQMNPNSITVPGGYTGVYACHPVTAIGYMFTGWRGSMKIKIKIAKTNLVTGRLQLMFVPNSYALPATVYDGTTAIREIVDIRVTDEVEFTLPYFNINNFSDPFEYLGRFNLVVLNPLTTPDTVSATVDLLMYVSFGDDFEFVGPYNDGVRSVPIPVFAAMDKLPALTVGGQHDQTLNTKFTEVSYGESFQSVRQLLVRNYPIYLPDNTVPDDVKRGIRFMPYYVYFSQASTLVQQGLTYDPMNFILSMYNSARGSMKVQLAFKRDAGDWKRVRLANTDSIVNHPMTVDYASNTATSFIFAASADTYVQGNVVNARIPFYYDKKYWVIKSSHDNKLANNAPQVGLEVLFDKETATNQPVFLYRTIGEDFDLSYFMTTPLFALH